MTGRTEWRRGGHTSALDGPLDSIWECGPGPVADEHGRRPGDRLVGSVLRPDAVEIVAAVNRARRMDALAERLARPADVVEPVVDPAGPPLTIDRVAAAADALDVHAGQRLELHPLVAAVMRAAATALRERVELHHRMGLDLDVIVIKQARGLLDLVEAAERLAAGS